jgi:hypothetical protein
MKDAVETTPVTAEVPKTKKHKEATKPAATPVEGATAVEGVETAPKKPRVMKPRATSKYSLVAGVEATKFRGQRAIVISALQGLGKGFFTVAEVAAKCEGLQSKTPVEDSAKYHLDAMVKSGECEVEITAVKAEPVKPTETANTAETETEPQAEAA